MMRPSLPISDCALLELTIMFSTRSSVVSFLAIGQPSLKSYPDISRHLFRKIVGHSKGYRVVSAHNKAVIYTKRADTLAFSRLILAFFLDVQHPVIMWYS